MSFFNIFRKKKQQPSEKPASADTDDQEESPIERLWRKKEEGGSFPWLDNVNHFGSDGFESAAEREAALKAVFPRPPFGGFRSEDGSAPTVESAVAMDAAGTVGGCQPPARNPYSPAANAAAVHAGRVSNGTNGMNINPLRMYGINDRVLRHYQNRCFITWNSCAMLACHELISRACCIPAEDAIAHGYKLVCVSPEHEQGEKHDTSEDEFLKQLHSAADKDGLNDLCVKLASKTKIFGVAIAIPRMVCTDDQGNETGEIFDYSEEYSPDKVTPNSFRGISVVEPQWLTYEFDAESSIDPTSPNFYVPTWIVKPDGTRIHRSWVIRCINAEVPDILKPTYYFGGIPLTQMMYERVWCADKIANEAPLLAMTKRLLIADGNMEQMIAQPQKANIFFKAINYFRDNWSVFVKKPSAQVQQIDTSLSDLTPLTMSQYQLAAAIAQIPVTKLMKNVPTGLQSTGQYEWDDYAQLLNGIQQNWLKPLLERYYELYCRSHYWHEGEQRDDIQLAVEFNPIDLPKVSEKTQQGSQQASMVGGLINAGVVTVGEARAILRKTENTFFDPIGPEVPKLLQKIEDAKDPEKQAQMQQQMQGGKPGMPGSAPGQPSPEDMANQQNDNVFQQALAKINAAEQGGGAGGAEGAEGAPGAEGGENAQGGGSDIFRKALSQIKEAEAKNGQGGEVQPGGAEGGGEQPPTAEGQPPPQGAKGKPAPAQPPAAAPATEGKGEADDGK